MGVPTANTDPFDTMASNIGNIFKSFIIVSESFNYTGSTITYTIPCAGYYKLTLAGGNSQPYIQNFYAGTNAGSDKTTGSGKGGYATGSYFMQAGTVLTIYVGRCSNSQLRVSGEGYPSNTAQTTYIKIGDDLLMQGVGGYTKVNSYTYRSVTDGTAGSSGSNPKNVQTGFNSVTTTNGAGSVYGDSYNVTTTSGGNGLSTGAGYVTIATTNAPSS